MKNILLFIKKHLTALIIVTIPVSLILGYLFDTKFLKPTTSIILFLMIYPMMINLNIKDILLVFKNPKPIFWSVIFNFAFVPFLAFAIGKIFFVNNPMLIVALLLIGLIPTSGMTASWTGLAGGKVQTSLVMMAVNLLLSIIMIPLYMNLLLGEVVDTPTMKIIMTLVKVILLPMILGSITRYFIIKHKGKTKLKELKPLFGGVSSLGVILIVLLAISLKSKTILGDIMLVAKVLLPIVLFYAILLVVAILFTKSMKPVDDKIPFVYSVTLRNLTIALGISLASFGESMAVLLIALSYVIQLPIASIYMKLSQKALGSK